MCVWVYVNPNPVIIIVVRFILVKRKTKNLQECEVLSSHLLLILTHTIVPLFHLCLCSSCPVHLNRLLIFHLLKKQPLLLPFTHDISCPLTAVGSSACMSSPWNTYPPIYVWHTQIWKKRSFVLILPRTLGCIRQQLWRTNLLLSPT